MEIQTRRRQTAYEQVLDMSTPRKSFYAMVAVSTTIAAYGLLANSTAVVIGAMLLAPLMGPILGVSLGLLADDVTMLRRALKLEVAGVLLSVAVAAAIGLLPLRADFGTEILARTQPTLYDIVVAVASGLAGAYALMDVRVAPALAGVAIATSLVPPLATCGICVSALRWDGAAGAFILFLANFFAIETASALVFVFFRVHRTGAAERPQHERFIQRFGPSMLALSVITIFVTHTLVSVIADQRRYRAVEGVLAGQLRSVLGAQLSELDVHVNNGVTQVIATVLTPQQIDPRLVGQMEDKLRNGADRHARLVIRSVMSRDADRRGPVYLPNQERERRADVEAQTKRLTRISRSLTELLALAPGARLADLRVEKVDAKYGVTAIVRTPAAVTPASVAEMETALSNDVRLPLNLTVRSIITRDADARGYVFDNDQANEPSPEDKALMRRLDGALRNQLKLQTPETVLQGFTFERTNGVLLIRAVARGPRILEPSQVKKMEDAFRKYVYPKTRLTVSSTVGADATSGGYVSDTGRPSAATTTSAVPR